MLKGRNARRSLRLQVLRLVCSEQNAIANVFPHQGISLSYLLRL